jgi:hypothetical protein
LFFAPIALLVGPGLLISGLLANARSRAAAAWPEVPARIENVSFASTSEDNEPHGLCCVYRYTVDGKDRTGTRVGFDVQSRAYDGEYAKLERHRVSGEKLAARVNPADPTDAVLFAHLSKEAPYIPWIGAGVGVFGLLFGIAGLRAIRDGYQRFVREAKPTDTPWRRDDTWKDHRVLSDSSALPVPRHLGIAATVACFLTIALVVSEPASTERRIVIALFVVPAGFLVRAAYLALRHAKYGRSTLHLTQLPAPPGGTLEGVIEVPAGLDEPSGVKLTLKCVKRTSDSDGESYDETLHESSTDVDPSDLSRVVGVTFVPVRVAVPADKPARDSEVSWYLVARCATRGVDFAATFEVPVFEAAENLIERRKGPLPG